MINNNETTRKLITLIWEKIPKSKFVKYILAELGNDDNVSAMLDFMRETPEWTEDILTKHALHLAGKRF
ncbi:MAG: hypothetical protein IKO53_00850 [Lachnospiraceae bacterium]|nr:hypothetical protein [Lachnospiraceae bacterium]